MRQEKYEAFDDGIAQICEVSNRKIIRTKLPSIRYGLRTVGIKRFYEAKVASDSIDLLVSIPMNKIIKRSDMILIGEEQYKIIQVQPKYDARPPCIYLALERNVMIYKDERVSDGKVKQSVC